MSCPHCAREPPGNRCLACELQAASTAPPVDKRLQAVRYWGACPSGGMHEGIPCKQCQARR